MEIYLDTAKIVEIKEAASWGVIRGLTTNPSLMSNTRRATDYAQRNDGGISGVTTSPGLMMLAGRSDYQEVTQGICYIMQGPISAEVVSLEDEGMLEEARRIAQWSPYVVIKVPTSPKENSEPRIAETGKPIDPGSFRSYTWVLPIIQCDCHKDAVLARDSVKRLEEITRMHDSGTRLEPNPSLVFVIISFSSDMDPIFDGIKAAGEKHGLRVERVKDIPGDYKVTDKFIEMIQTARLIVADLTYERPNVYFELGYARGLDKTIITTAREGTELHFDVKDWTCKFYNDSRVIEKYLTERFAYELGR